MDAEREADGTPSLALRLAPLWTFGVFFALCSVYIAYFVDPDGRNNSYAPALLGSGAYLVLNLLFVLPRLLGGRGARRVSALAWFCLATGALYLYLLLYLVLNTKGS